jgi:hypothetical protein
VELDSGTLYYLTDDGLYKTDGSSSTKLVANAEDNIIETAVLDGTTTIAYQVNSNENEGYKTIKTVTNSGVAGPTYDFSEFDYVQLLPNGLVLVKDGNTNFYLYDFDVAPTPTLSSIGFPLISINATTGYNLSSVLQLSGKEHEDPSPSSPMIITLTNGEDYKNYYYNGSTVDELTTSQYFISMAGVYDSNNSYLYVYLLTEDGKFYAANTPNPTTTTTFNLIHTTSNHMYNTHAFMYAFSKDGTTNIITKPKGVNDQLYAVSFSDYTVTGTGISANDVDDDYSEYLNSSIIVDSYEKDSIAGKLLVATYVNGMFEINLATNTSSSAENYTLD